MGQVVGKEINIPKKKKKTAMTSERNDARNQGGDELMFCKASITHLESPSKRTNEYLL